jgi:catalase
MRINYSSFLLLSLWAATSFAQVKPLTTNTGAPVGDNQNSKTLGNNGPVLLEDIHLIEKLAAFDRERIPERVVHPRGAGAFGEFVSAGDFSAYTQASLFAEKGKTTPVFTRFSTVINSKGSPETLRDPRGFAVKFYTDQGNYDIVGNDLPIFFIRDAMKFPDMVHSLKPSPITNRQDPTRYFDFFSQVPESTHMLTRLYTELGIPANYRQMDGSSVHAFKWVNAKGEITYVKYTWKTMQGVKGLTAEEAAAIQATDFQSATHDLYAQLTRGNFPSWELYVQMLKPQDFDKLDYNPLDPTKVWSEKDAKLILVGKMTLNKWPDNFFEEVEESAFSPATLVPGIEPSEDKLLQGRLFSYFDTQRYRIGANFQALPVNAPKVKVNSHNQDGTLSNRQKASDVNYQPSTIENGYKDDNTYKYATNSYKEATTVQHKIDKPDDFKQAGEFYRSLSEAQKVNLVKNLYDDLVQVTKRDIVVKMVSNFYRADADFGKRLAALLKVTRAEGEASFSSK